jgi:hypothetical protein
MNIPTRRQRRELAKQFGLNKEKESFTQWSERIKRSQEFGKMLHLQHLQNIENQNNPAVVEEASIEQESAGLTSDQWKEITGGENTEN